MIFRALFAFLALPVVVGGLLPGLLSGMDPWRTHGTGLGWPILSSGLMVLLWCVWDFYSAGKGTLVPWDPPKKLVTVGFYRFTRNPMYVSVAGCVAGWSLVAGSPLLAAYTGALVVAFHLRVVLYEEPTLARQFGSEWTQYCASVNRWLPGPRPKSGSHSR